MALAYAKHREEVEGILAKAEEAGLLRYVSPAAVLDDVKAMPGGEHLKHHTVWYWIRSYRERAGAA